MIIARYFGSRATATAAVAAPVITSANAVSINENAALSHALTASETVVWTKVGGSDQSRFTITGSTLGMTAQDFEAPLDSDTNNTYLVTVRATRSGRSTGSNAVTSGAYYVATTGNDTSGNGTVGTPWATITKALSVVPANATIYLRAGTYNQGGFTISTNNITLAGYPGEAVVVAAPTNNPAIQWCIRINSNVDVCTIRNLEITGGYWYALKTETTWDTGGDPLLWRGARDVVVEDCKLHDTGQDVVKVTPACDRFIIRRCEIYNSGLRDATNAEGIDAVNATDILIQDVYVHDVTTFGLYVKGGCKNPVIERCLVTNCGFGGIGLGQDTDLQWFSSDNNSPTSTMYECIDGVARNNIVMNCQGAGVYSQGALRSKIVNNTCINVAQTMHTGLMTVGVDHYIPNDGSPGGYTVPYPRPDKDPTFLNNIVTVTSGRNVFSIRDIGGGMTGTLTANNNIYYNPSGATFSDEPANQFGINFTAWKALRSTDAASIVADPILDGNGRLIVGSPAINAGSSAIAVGNDYDGLTRSGTRDIGAVEYGAGVYTDQTITVTILDVAGDGGGGGGSPTTVTWQNMTNATDDGTGGIDHTGGGYYASGRTTQTFSGDGYFEWTWAGNGLTVGIQNGTYTAGGASIGAIMNQMDFGIDLIPGDSTCNWYINGTNWDAIARLPVTGDIWRIERSGTSLLVKVNSGSGFATVLTITEANLNGAGFTWSDPYYGVVMMLNDSLPRNINAGKILA